MHYAAVNPLYKNLKIIKFLLNHPKVNLNAKDSYGRTFLHIFAMNVKSIKLMKTVLNHPRVIKNPRDKSGRTPFHYFILDSEINPKILELFLNHPEVKIDIKDGKGQTPEQDAQRRPPYPALFIKHSADANSEKTQKKSSAREKASENVIRGFFPNEIGDNNVSENNVQIDRKEKNGKSHGETSQDLEKSNVIKGEFSKKDPPKCF